jgi:Ca2+-binding RTX toxin-like protein
MMAYSATGTAGNDTLNQAGDTGPGTIVGLAGDDIITTGTGAVTVSGDSGNDQVFLQAGNTGTVSGGTENDFINLPTGTGSLVILGNSGADNVSVAIASTAALTIVGGDDSADGADFLDAGSGPSLIFGNGGADSIGTEAGNNTAIGGFGNDSLWISSSGSGNDLIFGNEGNDAVRDDNGTDTVFGGLGNDCVFLLGAGSGIVFGNEGADSIEASPGTRSSVTIVGGNDSADGDDIIDGSNGADLIFGNGGNDAIVADNVVNSAADTVIAGFGNDFVDGAGGNNLLFGNEGSDTITTAIPGNNTTFGGLGNDSIRTTTTSGRDSLQGNEGNDTIRGNADIDTISGGSGNDVFAYSGASDDGDNATGGGPVEFITDVNWAEDKFDTATDVTFAANMGAGTGGDLNASANNAIAAAFALAGGGVATVVAAQFTFGGRTYVAIEQTAGNNRFTDATDLLLDITGVTGTIATSNFI